MKNFAIDKMAANGAVFAGLDKAITLLYVGKW